MCSCMYLKTRTCSTNNETLMISINATFTPNDSKFFSTTNHPITIIVHLKIFGNEHSLFSRLNFVSEQRQILATPAKSNLQAFWASGLDHGRRLVRKMRRVALGRVSRLYSDNQHININRSTPTLITPHHCRVTVPYRPTQLGGQTFPPVTVFSYDRGIE